MAKWDTVPEHVKVMIDHRETLTRLDGVPSESLAKEALALLPRLTSAVAEDLRAPGVPSVDDDEASEFPGAAELDALVELRQERDTDDPSSARQLARDAIAEYLAHRALRRAQQHRRHSDLR